MHHSHLVDTPPSLSRLGRSATALTLALLLVVTAGLHTPTASAVDEIYDANQIAGEFLWRINKKRTENGVSPVVRDATLMRQASRHSQQCSILGKDQSSFDDVKGEVVKKFNRQDFTVYRAMEYFMRVVSYREVILNPKHTSAGAAVNQMHVDEDTNSIYVTLQFN